MRDLQSMRGVVTVRDGGEMSLQVEELESLDAQDDWGDYIAGVGIGLAAVGLVLAGVAIT
jgi:hypothetical protein